MGRDQDIAALGAEVASAALTPLRYLERSVYVWRDRPAVVDGDRAWTYAEHHDRVRRAAGTVCDELGIGKGDRVATLLPNTAPMLELHYAVPGDGGVLVPLNTRLAGPEYAYILEHSGATAVVAYRPLEPALDEALEDGALIIEWPERLGGALWPEALRLTLSREGEGARALTAEVPAAWGERWPPR
jgi:non-ribosomal peptide synthetase component F